MNFDNKQLELRRYEIQMHYHAAYLYWNLEGVLAEKWAHGPHFGAYRRQNNQVTLTERSEAGAPSPKVGIYGLKAAAFVSERSEHKEARDLALSWMEDVLTVLQPRRVTRLWVREFWSYPVKGVEQKVSDSVAALYPGIDEFMPSGYEARHGGLQFQALETTPQGYEHAASAIFGVFNSDQSRDWFNLWDPGEWALGLNYYAHFGAEDGIKKPHDTLTDLAEEVRSDARSLVTGSMMKAINSA